MILLCSFCWLSNGSKVQCPNLYICTCNINIGGSTKRYRSLLELLTNLLSNTPISGNNSNYVRVRACILVFSGLFVCLRVLLATFCVIYFFNMYVCKYVYLFDLFYLESFYFILFLLFLLLVVAVL